MNATRLAQIAVRLLATTTDAQQKDRHLTDPKTVRKVAVLLCSDAPSETAVAREPRELRAA